MSPTNATDFESLLAGDRPILADFYADWCGPCRALAPVLEQLSAQYGGRAEVIKIDVDADPELAARFDVRALPTLLLFNHGQMAKQFIGLTSANVLATAIDNTLVEIPA